MVDCYRELRISIKKTPGGCNISLLSVVCVLCLSVCSANVFSKNFPGCSKAQADTSRTVSGGVQNEETYSELHVVLKGILKAYQQYISSQDRPVCKFTPSCSQYSAEAFRKAGVVKGALLASDRIQRCHGLVDTPDGLRKYDPIEKYLNPGEKTAAYSENKIEYTTGTYCDQSQQLTVPEIYQKINSDTCGFLEFANHLFSEKEYLRAAAEYHRALFYLKMKKGILIYRIGECYRFGGLHDKAIRYFNRIVAENPQSKYYGPSLFQIGSIYFLGKNYDQSVSSLLNSIEIVEPDSEIQFQMKILLSMNYLFKKEWGLSHETLDTIRLQARNKKLVSAIRGYSDEGMTLPRKNSIVAAMLSSIVPGLGKMYCGRYADGLNSLAYNGAVIWLARMHVSNIDSSISLADVLICSTAVILYAGNIHGSYVAARVVNHENEDKLLNKIQVEFNINFFH